MTESVGLLDTSVVIDLLEIPLNALPIQSLVSAVTLAELAAGMPEARQDFIQRIMQVAFLHNLESVVPFDSDCAITYRSIYEAAKTRGRKPRGGRAIDYLIATTAARHKIPLFTSNPRDFEGLEGIVEIVAV